MRDPQECRSLARKCRERAKLQSSETLLIRCNFERSSWPIKPTKPTALRKPTPWREALP
jgi:hypothetical protein